MKRTRLIASILASFGLAIVVLQGAWVQGGQPPAHKNAQGQLTCPVMKSAIPSEAKAAGYSDYKGKRYYFCCEGCKPMFDKDPAKYASVDLATGGQPKDEPKEIAPVKVGKYQIELWPPEDGVYAGEEIDIEFGVFDSTQRDAQFGGMKGVDYETKAVVTMPSMPGMPEQKPHVHKEGRAGVQGLELYFPHGGEYQIDLTLTPKGADPIKASFKVDVRDERPANAARKPPYTLEIVEWPAHVMAGHPVDLKMRIVEAKTGKSATRFDVAHEKLFHLLIASKDLSVFMHEHPDMAPDGTWTYRATFPAGGEWLIFGDVAPTGKGSRILSNKVTVMGDPPKAGKLAVNLGPFTHAGLTGRFEPTESPIPLGKMTVVRVRLTDEKTGQPAGDTEPWLGAAGHLMIIHEDGQTMVHSHPKEDEENHALVKKGEVQFTARFPRPGLYRAYAQFQRGGEIKTLGFTLEVR